MHKDIEQKLYPEAQIIQGIDRVAKEVTAFYGGRDFTVISILKGSCIFASDLIRRIPIPLELGFCACSSYGSGTTSGKLNINFLPEESEVQGHNLLLVDDILDTGNTMHALKKEFLARGAKEVKSCVFLDKPSRRTLEFEADFKVFEVEDLFVVGYGLDYAGRYRNLPYVGSLKPEIYQQPAQGA
ncbi:MAG: hypoxanthine phosphoribosyltransferase [bacterium]|nr:hypoxanthine phosphoribosyltransferase [bacterium]